MAYRISKSDVEGVISRINRLRGVPEVPVTRNTDGTHSWNVGTWILRAGQVVEIVTDTGALSVKYVGTARELYYQLHAYLDGRYDAMTNATP